MIRINTLENMGHKYFIYPAILLIAIVLVSCHDEEQYEKRMKTILMVDCNKVEGSTANRDYYIRLEYDNQNRLVKVTEEHGEPAITTLTYSPGEVVVERDGRSLGKYTLNDEGYAVKFERGGNAKPCTYEYNMDGYLIKSNDGERESTYVYDAGDLISWASGNTTGTYVPSKIEDKLDAPAYYQFLYLHIRGYAEVTPAYIAGLFGKTSRHLPEEGELIFTLPGKNPRIRKHVITYEFDKEGYVSRMYEKTDGIKSGDLKVEYENYLSE